MTKNDELVLCVPTKELLPYSMKEGFFFWADEVKTHVFSIIDHFGVFLRRGDVEEDPNFKQIIPQIALIAENQIAMHEIPVSGGEARLHSLQPIFLGGHINKEDNVGARPSITAAAMREFGEECDYNHSVKVKPVGFVNINDTPVNSVHFGVVFVFTGQAAIDPFDKGDDGVKNLKFVTWDIAGEREKYMTPWSKLAFPALRERYEIHAPVEIDN